MRTGGPPGLTGTARRSPSTSPATGARIIWLPFLGGPVTWITHFMLVYLVAEAGCSGDGPGLRAVRPARAGRHDAGRHRRGRAGCLLFAAWVRGVVAAGRWMGAETGGAAGAGDGHDGVACAGRSSSPCSRAVAVLFVGLPALFLEC